MHKVFFALMVAPVALVSAAMAVWILQTSGYLALLADVIATCGALALIGKMFSGVYWSYRSPRPIFEWRWRRLAALVDKAGAIVFAPRDKYPVGVQSISESNHYDSHDQAPDRKPALLEPVVEVAPALPGPLDLADVLQTFRPSADRILLGLSPTGQIVASTRDLSHIALAAPTGGGKSTILRSLEAQLLSVGEWMLHCDPHFAAVDPLSGEDWRPIAAKLAYQPFTSPAAIAHVTGQTWAEMRRRYAARALGQQFGARMWIVFEELPAILAGLDKEQTKTFVKQYSDLLREARKVLMNLIIVSQDWQVETLGIDGQSELRANLRTAFFAGGGLATARALLDQQFKLPEQPLGRGVVLLRQAVAQPAPALTRIPSASNDAIYQLLAPAQQSASAPAPDAFSLSLAPAPAETPPAPPVSEREREKKQILDLYGQGYIKPYVIARKMGRAGAFAEDVRQVLITEGLIDA